MSRSSWQLKPPSDQPKTTSFWAKCLDLFIASKIPGWLAVALFIFNNIPDFKARIEFWSDAAKTGGTMMAPFSDIVASAYFNFALLAFGFGWLVFVGQPEKGVQRHPSLTLIGWVVASAFLIAVLATSGYGYFEIRVHESAVELLKSKKPERKLTENQITGIGSKICTQAHKIGPLIVFSVDDPEALQFAKSILFETAKCAMVNNPWHPKNITIPPIGHSTSTKETSLEVVVRDKNHPDAKSTALFIGMTEAGFDVKYGQWEDDPFLDIPTVFVYQQ